MHRAQVRREAARCLLPSIFRRNRLRVRVYLRVPIRTEFFDEELSQGKATCPAYTRAPVTRGEYSLSRSPSRARARARAPFLSISRPLFVSPFLAFSFSLSFFLFLRLSLPRALPSRLKLAAVAALVSLLPFGVFT